MAAPTEEKPKKRKPDYVLTPEPTPLSEEMPMTSEVQELINEVRPVVVEQLGRPVSRYEGLVYKTNEVLGRHYFVKVDIGDNRMVHMRVHRSPEGTITLQTIKQFTDNLDRPLVFL